MDLELIQSAVIGYKANCGDYCMLIVIPLGVWDITDCISEIHKQRAVKHLTEANWILIDYPKKSFGVLKTTIFPHCKNVNLVLINYINTSNSVSLLLSSRYFVFVNVIHLSLEDKQTVVLFLNKADCMYLRTHSAP